jgi:hypothetical protein
VLGAEVLIESGEQLIALGRLAGVGRGIREVELFLDVAPEEILDRTHLAGLGAEPLLGLLEEFAVRFADALEFLEVGHGECSQRSGANRKLEVARSADERY